ncbi:stemmadenine O-acetyltransferase-like [Tripterygium wilfordii]|uniref:stemmadenine O-acetyltransferase-like n=1 Tax=Tripterygium wilfordii TaxID=458696 RepID=UPI0018F852E3|nr:stemmadenine O-acetyltransferase-like [Tripterygium wilfordii]
MATTTIKVEIIERKTIKPSTPTPHNFRTFKFSLLDQFYPSFHIPLLLFYPAKGDTNHHLDSKQRSNVLKASLSKTLSLYYPFAGQIKADNISIECNDEGTMFVEARANCLLSDVLQNPSPQQLQKFLPIELEFTKAEIGHLLFVQVNFFECGGMAIGVCLSHKLADATTLITFIKAWASIALESDEVVVHPELFVGASVFPPVDYALPIVESPFIQDKSCVCRRLVFSAENIAAIRAKTASESVQQPTRVEAITALLWKCATNSSSSIQGTSSRSSFCFHAVNLRKRLSPPLSEYSVGNILGGITAETENTDIELPSLVIKLRKEFKELRVTTEVVKLLGDISKMMESLGKMGDGDFYIFSSWCRMPVYEADFGWGKPIWVTLVNLKVPNVVVLVDTKEGDGIEAWVYLVEEEMSLFECNQELLSFASVNPSVI